MSLLRASNPIFVEKPWLMPAKGKAHVVPGDLVRGAENRGFDAWEECTFVYKHHTHPDGRFEEWCGTNFVGFTVAKHGRLGTVVAAFGPWGSRLSQHPVLVFMHVEQRFVWTNGSYLFVIASARNKKNETVQTRTNMR